MITPLEASDEPRVAWWLAFIAAAAVLAFKAPDALLVPQFWAEDASVFFLQQHLSDRPQWFQPYAGYLLFTPRFVAWLGSSLAAGYVPAYYSIATLLIGAATLASLRDIAAGLRIPFSLLLMIFALIPTNAEVFGNLTNLQWIMQFYLLAVIFRSHAGRLSAHPAITIPCILAVGLTGPFSTLIVVALIATIGLSCLFQFMHMRYRYTDQSWLARPEMLVLFACAGIQLATMLILRVDLPATAFAVKTGLDLLHAFQQHLFARQLLPDAFFILLVVALVTCAVRFAERRSQRFCIVLLAMCVTVELISVAMKFGAATGALMVIENGDRYFLLSKLAFWACLAVAVLELLRGRRPLAIGLVTCVLGLVAAQESSRLMRPAMADLKWRNYAGRIDAGEAVTVPIHPRPWSVHVPARPAQRSDD